MGVFLHSHFRVAAFVFSGAACALCRRAALDVGSRFIGFRHHDYPVIACFQNEPGNKPNFIDSYVAYQRVHSSCFS